MTNSDLNPFRLGVYGMTDDEVNEIKFDLKTLDEAYDKWAKEDDSLSGVLNTKLTKIKNVDFRLKLDAWKNRVAERKL